MEEKPQVPPVQAPPFQEPDPYTPPAVTSDEQLQRIADTVGMVPSLRKSDNLLQGIVVLVGTLLGGAVGYTAQTLGPSAGFMNAVPLGIAGMIFATFASGLFILIRNKVRR